MRASGCRNRLRIDERGGGGVKSRLDDTLKEFGGPIAYWPGLARLTGSAAGGVLLSQVCYWWNRVGRPFYKVDAELAAETGLSNRALRTARERLRGVPGVKIERRGWPARVFYEIDEAVFLAQLPSLTKVQELSAQFDENGGTGLTKVSEQSDENGGTIKEQRLPETTAKTTESLLGRDGGGSEKSGKRRPPKRLKPPTVEEVRSWIETHPKYGDVDADKFFDYYAAAEWRDRDGKPVRSWQQRIISWSTRNGKSKSQGVGRDNQGQAGCVRRNGRNQAFCRSPLPTADADPDAIDLTG